MRSLIVSYDLRKTKPYQRLLIQRALHGYDDFSNSCKYRYKRKGLIEKYSGRRLNRGVFIIPEKFKDNVIPLLEKNKARLEVIPINLP